MNAFFTQGDQTSLMNCANVCKKLEAEFLGVNIQQYRQLPDYVLKLRKKDHDVVLIVGDKQLARSK